MGKFQNVNFEKPVVLKVAHDYNNKKNVIQLFKQKMFYNFFLRSSALKQFATRKSTIASLKF
jgi:uncharacterized membrane protein